MVVNRYFKKGKYFAFYIDLLGQKDFYSSIPLHGDLQCASVEKTLLAVTHTVRKVLLYSREFLPKFICSASEAYNLNRNVGYEKYIKMECREYQLAVERLEYGTQQFSDSLLFYLRDDGNIASDIFPFCIALLTRLAMEYFPNQIAFRGAISYADGWETPGNSIYGPILDRLVYLEENTALIPRIVIDDGLIQYCKNSLPNSSCGQFSAENLAFTMLSSFFVDIDGKYALDIWGRSYYSSLLPNEIPVHRDLLVASCKFVYDQYHNFLDRQKDVSVASVQMSLASVAYKYAMAYKQLKERLSIWGVADIDFGKPMPEYKPTMGNYEDVEVVLAEYTVLRLEFHCLGKTFDNAEIYKSRRLNSTVRLLKRSIEWLSKHGKQLSSVAARGCPWSQDEVVRLEESVAQQEIVVNQIANVVVVAIRNGRAASEYLMWIFVIVSVLILRLMRNMVFVKGSVVSANGWKATEDCVCGPVMQRSYEFSKKIAVSYRIVLDGDLYNVIQHSVATIKHKMGEVNNRYPHLGDAVSRDMDGAYFLDYIRLYGRIASMFKRVNKFNKDLINAAGAIKDAVSSGDVSGRAQWGFYMIQRYFEESCKHWVCR